QTGKSLLDRDFRHRLPQPQIDGRHKLPPISAVNDSGILAIRADHHVEREIPKTDRLPGRSKLPTIRQHNRTRIETSRPFLPEHETKDEKAYQRVHSSLCESKCAHTVYENYEKVVNSEGRSA